MGNTNTKLIDHNKYVRTSIVPREELLFDESIPGRHAYSLPEKISVKQTKFSIKENQQRKTGIRLPELSESMVIRHFHRLSTQNYSIDMNFYPLGSCTMKYNPRLNEQISSNPNFLNLHPATPQEYCQATMSLLYELEKYLLTITDMDAITLNPAAGAHGELTALLLIRKYFSGKDIKRKLVLVPDSAHGTNPASCILAGFEVKEIKSDKFGMTDIEVLKANLNSEVACIMLTIPNTLGVFDSKILQISNMVHENGSLLYMDGANFNAIIGKVSIKKMGVDAAHLNLHKTFSTPHGGGGPGAGPVVVNEKLSSFLPGPKIRISKTGYEYFRPENSIGTVRPFVGQFGMLIRALVYIKTYGTGIHKISEHAVLNANYMKQHLKKYFTLNSDKDILHEVVFSDKIHSKKGISTLDIAKTLLDYGFHPPTIYFPLNVSGAMLIEPTETEPIREMKRFIEVMQNIALTNETEKLKDAPHFTFCQKIDEVGAARNPILNYFDSSQLPEK